MLLEADLGPRVAALPSRIRVAVAVACAERVLPLFEVMSDRGVETARSALRLAWSWAEGGEVDPRARRSMLSTIGELLPKENDDRGAAIRTLERTGIAVMKALEATAVDEATDEYCAQAAALAVKKAQEAIRGFELAEDGKMWAMEEQSFQQKIVALAEKSGDVRTGAKAERSPSFLDWLEEEWGWERDDDEGGDP